MAQEVSDNSRISRKHTPWSLIACWAADIVYLMKMRWFLLSTFA